MLNVDKIPNPNEKIKYLSIPFINDKSEIIGRKIQEAVNEHFTNINLRVAFKSPAISLSKTKSSTQVNYPW